GNLGCTRSELPLVVPTEGRDRRARIVAVDDKVVTSEDHAAVVAVTANDRPGLPLRSVNIDSVGTPHRGAAVLRGRSIEYDPRGRFDSLKPGQVGHDEFDYRATDGVHTAHGRALVSVTGVNDPPVAVNDSVKTSEDAAKALNIDVVKAGAPPGTPG